MPYVYLKKSGEPAMHRSLLTAIAIIAIATPSFAAPKKVSNSVKYRDAAPYKRAANGDASIQTRALLGSDGVTTIEITTGQLDVANSAKAVLEKVQLKVSGKNGWTKNYNNTNGTGTFVLPVTGLTRGTTIQIHANVRGTSSRNMQVLQVTDTVRLRPDLQVSAVTVPANVTAGVPVTISASVRELNGDTGARATCSLSVNGKQLDTATNIWVDAGDSVQCLFNTSFAAGTNNVTVTAGNVVPGDWDLRNNSASVSVTATAANRNTWSATAKQTTLREKRTTTYSNRPADKVDTYDGTEVRDALTFNGTVPYRMDLFSTRITVLEKTDGVAIQNFNKILDGYPNGNCIVDMGRNLVYSVCNTTDGKTTINMTRHAFTITYLSRGWINQYNPRTGEMWDEYVMDETRTQGQMPRYGNTVSLDITLSEGGRTWTADAFMNMVAFQNAPQSSRTCRTDAAGVTSCTDYWSQTTGKTGADESY